MLGFRVKHVAVSLAFLGILSIPLFRIAFFALSPAQLTNGSNPAVIIEVSKGQNPNEITKMLASNGMISDAKSFVWLGRLTRQWKHIKAGEYKITSDMTPREIFATLTSGISVAHPITVREGENMYEIAADIASKGLAPQAKFLEVCKDPIFIASLGLSAPVPASLEGYLFPDTYFFNRSISVQDMARQMVKHFFSVWGEKEELRAKELKMNRHEVIILASMIEKETGAPQERPMIGSIFHNRLQKRMRLQSDPTTIYGMWSRYKGKIHRSDLFEKNHYNTYMIAALPSGPISNPGKESIQAALFPSTTPYLYFVSHNDGTHQFSKTLAEHNLAVRKFQLDPKARAGKSWRDLQKKTHLPGAPDREISGIPVQN